VSTVLWRIRRATSALSCVSDAAVADVTDALLSDRPYRAAYPLEQALDILLGQRGNQLDPRMVDALVCEFRP